MTPLKVLIADDHPLFREGLRTLLHDLGADVVAEAGDGAAAIAAARQHRPDVVLMDLRMPVLSGVDATAAITRECPTTAVLVLTMNEDAESLQAALRAGARGYLLKEATKTDVDRALQAVTRGDVVIAAGAASRLRDLVARPLGTAPFPNLTEREQDVLALVAQGLDNATIARRLFLAEKTIRNQVSTVLTKLNVETRAQAIALARDAGVGGAD